MSQVGMAGTAFAAMASRLGLRTLLLRCSLWAPTVAIFFADVWSL